MNKIIKVPQGKSKRTLSSFIRGLDILEYIIEHKQVRPRDIAQHFDIPSSNVTLFLSTLAEKNYIVKNELTNAYHYTNKFSHQFNHTSDLINLLKKISQESMHKLHMDFNENVLLSFLQDNHYTYHIDEIKSSNPIQIVNNNLKHFPLHVTANGKVILSFMDEALQKKYLSKISTQQYTESTITSKSTLLNQLKVIQKEKVAYNFGEYEKDIMAISSPIFLKNKVTASITVQFPVFRYQKKQLYQFAPKIKKAGEEISKQLATYYL